MRKNPAHGRILVLSSLTSILEFIVIGGFLLSPKSAQAAGPTYYLSVTPGPDAGQVTLNWIQIAGDVSKYNIVYGVEPGKYQYGALGVGASVATGKPVSYTVNYLTPGTTYYFALSAIKAGKAQPFTGEVSSLPKEGIVTPPPSSTQPTTSLTGPVPGDKISDQDLGKVRNKDVGLHHLSVKKGAKSDEVILEWSHAFSNTDNYDVVYGTEPGKFQYGAQNIGKTDKFAVKGLDPNKQYYFALVPKKGGRAQYITQEATTSGAEPAKIEEIKQASGQPTTTVTTTASSSGQGSQATSSGSPAATTGGGSATTTTTGSGTGSSGKSTQTTTSPSSSKSESGKKESKKSKKEDEKKVKGASTVRSFLLQIIDFLKKAY